ncbi:hypothetical protein GCM10009679_13010 [Saccharothrix algeriensis]|uniref:Uncharacterized protein n=1 Tax=Catellatospora bangladeshensis TaxID=310355 RepID=A0A8J3JQG4_9ACTN|nr:hypothetical protein Cba03nite_27180 [Catellatospora bangladeshensis]
MLEQVPEEAEVTLLAGLGEGALAQVVGGQGVQFGEVRHPTSVRGAGAGRPDSARLGRSIQPGVTDIVVGVYQNPPPKRPNPILGLVKKPMMLALAGGAVVLLLVLACCCGLWVFGNLNTGSV